MKNDVNMEIVKNVRGVLITRAKSGASMQEIIGDYRELVGENLQYFTLKAILDTTPGFSYTMDRGEPIYRFESRQSKHISEMVKKQKIAKKSSYGCKRKMNNSYGRNAKMARGNNPPNNLKNTEKPIINAATKTTNKQPTVAVNTTAKAISKDVTINKTVLPGEFTNIPTSNTSTPVSKKPAVSKIKTCTVTSEKPTPGKKCLVNKTNNLKASPIGKKNVHDTKTGLNTLTPGKKNRKFLAKKTANLKTSPIGKKVVHDTKTGLNTLTPGKKNRKFLITKTNNSTTKTDPIVKKETNDTKSWQNNVTTGKKNRKFVVKEELNITNTYNYCKLSSSIPYNNPNPSYYNNVAGPPPSPKNLYFYQNLYNNHYQPPHHFNCINQICDNPPQYSNNYHSYDTNNYHSYGTNNFRNSGYLCNYQLFGDDFFLTLAGYELGSRVETAHRIHHSGLCISGQTIHDVYNRVMKMDHINPNIILNIGSVDILHGHNLFNIVSDFRMLMWAFQSRGIKPILTTLPPIGNMAHTHDYRFTVIKFNEFLMSQNIFPVIDLFQCMVDPNGKILYECYQTEARYVTGSSQPHLLWNKLGRQRILQAITKQLSTVLTFA